MRGRVLVAATTSVLLLAVSFVLADASASSQTATPAAAGPATPDARTVSSRSEPVPPVVQQMQQLERDARVRMICYSGPSKDGRRQIPAIALSLTK
jgi:hypothetical protein